MLSSRSRLLNGLLLEMQQEAINALRPGAPSFVWGALLVAGLLLLISSVAVRWC